MAFKRWLAPLALVALLPLLFSVVIAVPVPALTVRRTDVYVMMPLDLVTNDGYLRDASGLRNNLAKLKSGGVDGIMIDVWWGIAERAGPRVYDFNAYQQVAGICRDVGLKMQAVLSFHKCGGNVGDTCNIPLPSWVLKVGATNDNIFYKDKHGHADQEYLSLGVDNLALFDGRSGVQMYADFMEAFAQSLASYIPSTVVEIEVGLGPAGELRYPSYQLDRWSFPGIGEFQCYDKYMLAMLKDAATKAGRPEWGNAGPSDAGTYNNRADDVNFFSQYGGGDNYKSAYGQFFLDWYQSALIQHGRNVLAKANAIFTPRGLKLSAKISGIHWWYNHPSHAAEATAGYHNVWGRNAYLEFARMFKTYNTAFLFTCLEMRNTEQPASALSNPETLVAQTRSAAYSAGAYYAGENALPRYDQTAYNQIAAQSIITENGQAIVAFTYLRMDAKLLGEGWNTFVGFVNRMHNL